MVSAGIERHNLSEYSPALLAPPLADGAGGTGPSLAGAHSRSAPGRAELPPSNSDMPNKRGSDLHLPFFI